MNGEGGLEEEDAAAGGRGGSGGEKEKRGGAPQGLPEEQDFSAEQAEEEGETNSFC